MSPDIDGFDDNDRPHGQREKLVSQRLLTASVPDLVHGFVMLERPAAVTQNDAVRITQIGPYAAPSAPGGPFLVESGWISLRVDTEIVTSVHLLGADADVERDPDDALPALQLGVAHDRSIHRCHALQDADRLVLDGLARSDGAPVAALASVHPAPRRDDDEEPDQRERLDELITRSAGAGEMLPHRHVDPGVLFALLEHACTVALPIGIAVLASGAMHAVQDAIQSVSPSSGLAVVTTHDAVVEIALSDVRQCVLLRLHGAHGVTSMLELYDVDNRCVAVFSQFGMVGEYAYESWEHLVDSLPLIG